MGKPQPQSSNIYKTDRRVKGLSSDSLLSAAPTTAPMTQEQFANMSDLWLASRAAGVAKALGVDQVAAEGMVLSALQVVV